MWYAVKHSKIIFERKRKSRRNFTSVKAKIQPSTTSKFSVWKEFCSIYSDSLKPYYCLRYGPERTRRTCSLTCVGMLRMYYKRTLYVERRIGEQSRPVKDWGGIGGEFNGRTRWKTVVSPPAGSSDKVSWAGRRTDWKRKTSTLWKM